jgi:hypothetical protein
MLDTMDKAASSSDGEVLNKPNLSERRSLLFTSVTAKKFYFGQEWYFL